MADTVSLEVLVAPTPSFQQSIAQRNYSNSPFVDSIWPYAELYEFGSGQVRAASDNVLDWTVKWVIDKAGSLSCTFSAADAGLLTDAAGNGLSLPFTDTLRGATTPLLRNSRIAAFPSPPYGPPMVTVGGTPYDATTFGTPSMDLQLRFSLGGGDFIDAKKMVLNTKVSVESETPLITEEGNSLWEQYGKIIVPHYSAEGIYFIDFVFADPGMIKSYSYVQTTNTSTNSSFLNQLISPVVSGGKQISGLGYLSADGTLPFLGGVFKIYCPVDLTTLIVPDVGGFISTHFGSPTAALSTTLAPGNSSNIYSPFIYFPLVNKNLANLPMSIDIQAGTFTKMLEAITAKAAAIVATPYVAHYVEDTSDLYTGLTHEAYPNFDTTGTNTLLLGQIFKSNLTFISSDVKENMQQLTPIEVSLTQTLVEKDKSTLTKTIEANLPTYAFSDVTLATEPYPGELTDKIFNPNIVDPVTMAAAGGSYARIEKGITITPDYSSVWDSAYFIGGSTDCDFPQNGRVTAVRIINDPKAINGKQSWATNIPLVGVYITDIVGGVYVQMGNQIFTLVSPNFGVYDIQIDPHTNDVYVATGSGVYVCRHFSLIQGLGVDGGNVWTNIGNFNAPIKKIQLNIGTGYANKPGPYIVRDGRLDENGAAYNGCIVYALALGTDTSTIGVFSHPENDPSAIVWADAGHTVSLGTRAKNHTTSGHPGWDLMCSDQGVLTFAVLQDKVVFWANSQNAGLIQSHDVTNSNPNLQYNLNGGDGVAGVANGVQIDNSTSDDNVIANSLLAIQQYPSSTSANTTSNTFSDYLVVITNGVTGHIYTLNQDEVPPRLRYMSSPGDDGGLSNANGGLPINLNSINVLPMNTIINGVPIYAIAGTDQGIYASVEPMPVLKFVSMNGLNGLDAENILTVAVGKPYTDTHVFGNSGYSLPVTYYPLWAAGDNNFFESTSGGNWWIDRVNDNVTLAASFYQIYGAWVQNANNTNNPVPKVFTDSSLPPPVPELITIPLVDAVSNPGLNVSGYPQGPNYPDLTNICWIRNRNERGEFYYYIGRVGTTTNPRPISLLQKGQAVATVSSLAVDDDLINTELCSTQLALVTKKWFIENSIPPYTIAIESSFVSRFAALRFLRPMHIVHVFFNTAFYTEDGNDHIFMDLDDDFYVIDHTIKYGGDSKPYAITETTLSSEMQNSRTSPDDLAADLQEIVKNMQLRG